MLRFTRAALRLPVGKERPKSAAPLITRTRTWRGTMQVKVVDEQFSNKKYLLYGVLGAPLRVGSTCIIVFGSAYMILGHDEFMFQLMGYESEMQYEGIVNPAPEDYSLQSNRYPKASLSPLRELEQKLHPAPLFEEHLITDTKKQLA